MSTMVCWFASEVQARQAVLDLLTGGVPREDISVLINTSRAEPVRDARIQSQVDTAKAPGVPGDSHPRDFVEALAGTTTLTLADCGPVIAAGPLADTLVSTNAQSGDDGLASALTTAGIAVGQARQYAAQLDNGGALLVVQADDRHDTLVSGVFRHNAVPALEEQEELVGPTPVDEVAADEVGGPVSTSIGALTGGSVPGSWGAAGTAFEDQVEERAGDERNKAGA